MVNRRDIREDHPSENDLAEFMSGSIRGELAEDIREHLSECDRCLAAYVAAYEAVGPSCSKRRAPRGRGGIFGHLNIYLVLAALSFIVSFVTPRYFIQLLVATLILGIKWVVDSKSTKMLVMIYEAWKSGGGEEASRVLERLGRKL
jgi:hypothetical protein